MRLSISLLAAGLLWAAALPAVHAQIPASASDIDKAMNLLPPDVQKDLNVPPALPAIPPLPPMSLHCRQLLAAIEQAKYAEQQPPRGMRPQTAWRGYGAMPVTSPGDSGLQVEASNSIGIHSRIVDRRARLEAQFERECR